ncbi:MAG: LnmK family bifunctional acyltransferase/decarboxylase [Umezawaea sp.]
MTALDGGALIRTETATPGMCGPTTLFAGRVGDWTWDAVSESCGINAYRACNEQGAPTYLSFYYFRIRSTRQLHPAGITFGDRLRVTSRVFGAGSESVLTVHRVQRDTGEASDGIVVENFNRWITRTEQHSNHNLVRSSPVGFRHAHLPPPPPEYSPRLACANARTQGSFLAEPPVGRRRVLRKFVVDYHVDASRDLNAVGLLYFAAYFAIVDWAVLRLWEHLGRDVRDYLTRVVLDQRICYLGNADGDATIRIELNLWRADEDPRDELVEVVLHDQTNETRLAVCALRLLHGGV